MDRWILICSILAVIVLLILRWWDRRRIRQLWMRTDHFLVHPGDTLDIALGEDDYAKLQNVICELQDRCLRSMELQKEEALRTSSLTADISHQLKTPLTTLRLYAEMDEAAHMEESLEQISRMEQLIHGLLRLERLCADGYRFSFATHSINQLILDQWCYLSPAFPHRELVIDGNAVFRCDSKWLGEAFLNLLKNACEHTDSGGSIHITLEQAKRTLFCTIEDDGGGVSEKDLPHLFRRFYRAEGQNESGAGLGLAIVREIIRRHHGTIVASNSEKGLKMEITLPILEGDLTNS